MENDATRPIPEAELRTRLERLPGVKRVDVNLEDPEWDFFVHFGPGDSIAVHKEAIRAAWKMDDKRLLAQLREKAQAER